MAFFRKLPQIKKFDVLKTHKYKMLKFLNNMANNNLSTTIKCINVLSALYLLKKQWFKIHI